MTSHKRNPQYARPVVISSAAEGQEIAHPLERLTFSSQSNESAAKYDESWLQRLLHRYPESLPVSEIEPGFGRIVSIAVELKTPAGYVDNLFVTQEGNLVLVECKLWRNPAARRQVLAQIIDYAQSMSNWKYEDLDAAVKRGLGADSRPIAKSLIDGIRDSTGDPDSVDEPSFIDAVQKNLRFGRMLLLIVGDGIREDAEGLTSYLQQHAGFHFTLGLIEVALYRLPNNDLLVQPRVLARTLNIERGIVTIVSKSATEPPVIDLTKVPQITTAISLTEASFFEKLRQADPHAATSLPIFAKQAEELDVFLNITANVAMLRWESQGGKRYSLGGVNIQGRITTYSVGWAPNEIGHVEIGHEYLQKLSKLVGGHVRETPRVEQWYVVISGTSLPPAVQALNKSTEWLNIISEFQKQVNNVESNE